MVISYWPNMGNTDGKHTWVSCGSYVGHLRGKTHGYHVENCCILQCAPLVAAHVWLHNGNLILAQHGQYGWQTHMSFIWIPCGSFERQNTWVPRGKLLHTPVCPISGNPRMAHERHTRGSYIHIYIYIDKALYMFLLQLCSLWCAQIIEFNMMWRFYVFVYFDYWWCKHCFRLHYEIP